MKAAFIGNEDRISAVYGAGRRQQVEAEFDVIPGVLSREDVEHKSDDLRDTELLFSTWGMPALSPEQIALLPSLKALFYAAGTVQKFARPFLESGVKVFSAWAANAVPVAEYTVAQILLANKGILRSSRATTSADGWRKYGKSIFPGNFETTVALLGAGMIGRKVIELLQPYSLKVLVFDPFLPDEEARGLGVEKVGLDEAFQRGFVVSNHLANLPATVGMITGEHISRMQENATFINSGRGATVDEQAMIEVLKKRPDLTAVLDVSQPEPPDDGSPLYSMTNVILTPHIAGSQGNEFWRLADYMIDEAIAFRDGNETDYEVTLAMLETMA